MFIRVRWVWCIYWMIFSHLIVVRSHTHIRWLVPHLVCGYHLLNQSEWPCIRFVEMPHPHNYNSVFLIYTQCRWWISMENMGIYFPETPIRDLWLILMFAFPFLRLIRFKIGRSKYISQVLYGIVSYCMVLYGRPLFSETIRVTRGWTCTIRYWYVQGIGPNTGCIFQLGYHHCSAKH